MKNLFFMAILATTVACNNESSTLKPVKKKITTQRAESETDLEYADKLTRVGEILINNPVGMFQAHGLFEKALAINPNNQKALFYSAITGLVEPLKGSVNRGKDLLDNPAKFDELVKYIKEEVKYPEILDLIVGKSGAAKFNSEQDIKRFVQVEVVGAFDKAVSKLGKVNTDIELIITQLSTNNSEKEVNCHTTETPMGEATVCEIEEEMDSISALKAKTYSVDSKDVKIIANGLKAYAAALKLYTPYSIEGSKALANEINAKKQKLGRGLKDIELHSILRRYTNFLTLEKDHQLDEVANSLSDIVKAAMDLETLNNEFCETNLRSHNLIKNICFSEDARENLELALEFLSGPREVKLGQSQNGSDVTIVVDLPGYLKNPVRDLKTLLPTEYDENGRSKITTEPELNGLFPNRDLLEKMKQLSDSDSIDEEV